MGAQRRSGEAEEDGENIGKELIMMRFQKITQILTLFIFLTGPLAYAETVKIIAEDDWYPYSAQFDNGLRGIAVDIIRAAFAAEGVGVEFDVMNYDRGMALVKGGLAIGCFDAPRTNEIENIYLWHDEPLFSAVGFFYATSDYTGKINGVKEVIGKKVGLTQGYGYGDVIDLNTDITKEYSKTDTIIIKKLIAKRLDFIVLYDMIAGYLIPKLNVQGEIKPVGEATYIDLYIAFSKGNPAGKKFRDIFSRGFRKIKDDGTYQKIVDEWGLKLKGGGQ